MEPAVGVVPTLRGRFVLTLVMMLVAVLACRDAWMDIVRIVQKDPEASHILLVPLVFARIAWVRRKELSDWRPQASYLGVLIALAGVGLWLLGYIKAMQVVWHFGAILTLVGAYVCVNGMDVVRRLWPAFLVLLFLMPLPGVIRHPLALFLQNASAQATEVVIVAIGFDLVRYGNLLLINEHAIGVAEACNGMRMVSMLILIVFAFIFSEKVRPWVRVSLILSAVPIAILCNIIRLVPTVLAYGYFSHTFADQMHAWLGWGLAFASYFGLMGLLWLMRWLMLPVDPDPKRRVMRRPRTWHLAQRRVRSGKAPQGRGPVGLAGVVLGVLVVLGSAVAVGQALPDGDGAKGYHAKVRAAGAELPRQVGNWSSLDTELPEAAVALLRPNVLISRQYTNDVTEASFSFLVVQCADARDMEGHYPPNCYPTSGWTSQGQQSSSLQIGELSANAMEYDFELRATDGVTRIHVVNLLLIPSDGFVTSMSSIRNLGGTVSDRYFGAAQVQFVFSGGWNRKDRLQAVQEMGVSLEPLIDVILDKTGKKD